MTQSPTRSKPSRWPGTERAARHASHDRLPHDGQGIVRTDTGEEQPADKARAQHATRANRGDGPPRADARPDRPNRE
jgi:hypothetical protein